MSVFVDTSALIAFIMKDDDFFQESYSIFSRLMAEKSVIISSNYVILETIAILNNRIGIEAVKLLRDNILPVIKVYWIDAEIHDYCLDIQVSANRKKISLVDYTSFEIMRKLNIKNAFTFDSDFKEMGFNILKG